MTVTIISIDSLFKDLYPRGGERIKLWVVEYWREAAWERETCPRVPTAPHLDNTGAACREAGEPIGSALWIDLERHDCCHICGDLAEATRARPDVAAWHELKAARPPITTDREVLSDEIAPHLDLRDHPILNSAIRRTVVRHAYDHAIARGRKP